jgi:hypothetical protein
MKAATIADLRDQLPEGLWEATLASIEDSGIPKQGCSALRTVAQKHLVGIEMPEVVLQCYVDVISDWLQAQEPAQELAQSYSVTLDELLTWRNEDSFPSWFGSEWHCALRLPWSEALVDAVIQASSVITSVRSERSE